MIKPLLKIIPLNILFFINYGYYYPNLVNYTAPLDVEYIDSVERIGFTLSYDEKVKGWVSFKSYIPELGVSSANKYYTFNGGDIYLHHVEKFNLYKSGSSRNNIPPSVELKDVDRNTFYDKFTNSNVTFIFNQEPSIIKEFRTLNYEGTQSKIDSFYDERNIRLDNLLNKDGWYSNKITTEKQTGSIPEFINKEDKWFNYIKGEATTLENLDSSEFNFQGLGIPTLVEEVPSPFMFLFPQPNTTVNTPLFGPTGEIGNLEQVVQTSAWSGNPVVEYTIEFSIQAATGGVGPYEYEYKFRRNQYMFIDASLTTNISNMQPIPITMSATQLKTLWIINLILSLIF